MGNRSGLAEQHAARLASRTVVAVFLERTALQPFIAGAGISLLIAIICIVISSRGFALMGYLGLIAVANCVLFCLISLIIYGVMNRTLPRQLSRDERRNVNGFITQLLRRIELDRIPLPLMTWRLLSQSLMKETATRELEQLERTIDTSPLLTMRFKDISRFYEKSRPRKKD